MLTDIAPTAEELARPSRQALLHVLHSWGGGIARWTEDFIHHTSEQRHLILYSRGDRNVFGRELALVDPARSEAPLALWELTPPISNTSLTHPNYAAVLNDLLAGFAVEKVVVSSLIGHSLEVLITGLPTLRVLHDLYPYCPAMFGYFGASCKQCEPDKLATCLRTNPYNECWHNSVPEDWLALRQAYANALLKPQVRLIAPTYTVRDRFYRLYPEIAGKTCHIIAHGIDLARIGSTTPPLATEQPAKPSFQSTDTHSASGGNRKLHIVVPGRLEPHKGLQLLQEALPQLIDRTELLLLGCGLLGQSLADFNNVTMVPDYNAADLGPLIQDFAPDCALLLSVLPETFSYTLSEMMALGIPPLATDLGAFAERIHHGKNGFLYEPNLQALIALVTSLAKNRSPLVTVAQHLRSCPIRQAKDMVQDYQALPPTTSAKAVATRTKGWLGLGIEKAQAQFYRKYASLEQEILHQARDLEEAQQQVTALRQKLAHSQAQTIALEQEFNALHHSNSWRLTAPLRIITMTLRAWRTQLRSASLISADSDSSQLAAGEKSKKEAPPQGQIGSAPSLSTPLAPSPGNSLLFLPPYPQGTAAQTLRIRLRKQLAIPDAARIVLGVTHENRPETVQAFIQAAATLTTYRREMYFLWLEGENAPPLSPKQKAWGLAIAPRRLFFEKTTAATLSTYLAASDLLYLPDGEDEKLPLPAEITAFEAPLINNSTDGDLTTLIIKALQAS